MDIVLAKYSVSISELKKNPSQLIESGGGEPIAVLNHNKPTAYLVPAETYIKMMEIIDDAELKKVVEQRLKTLDSAVEVELDAL